jgi:hypothetical protein
MEPKMVQASIDRDLRLFLPVYTRLMDLIRVANAGVRMFGIIAAARMKVKAMVLAVLPERWNPPGFLIDSLRNCRILHNSQGNP